jgi:hypothetical protein
MHLNKRDIKINSGVVRFSHSPSLRTSDVMKKIVCFLFVLMTAAILPVSAYAAQLPEDGRYTVEITLSGGSGRATVESPTEVTVLEGKMTAIIVWSSPNYDLMIVDDTNYYPVNTEGNSAFEIPVTALDENIPVSAETVAMSVPHVIDYTLRFDAGSLSSLDNNHISGLSATEEFLIAAAIIAVLALAAYLITQQRQKGKKKHVKSNVD